MEKETKGGDDEPMSKKTRRDRSFYESITQQGYDLAPSAETKPRRKRATEEDEKIEDSSGGWMMNKAAVRDSEPAAAAAEEQVAVNSANKNKFFEEATNDGIIDIPDLEDDGETDNRVAHAPRNVLRKIPTLGELETDIKSSIPKAEGGLDLSILLSVLVPRSQLNEPDTPWTFESLLREVTDELTGTEKIVTSTINKPPSNQPSSPGHRKIVGGLKGKG